MRARNIKPAFFQNELLTEIDFAGRLLFIGLWTLADREGRLEDRPKRIKMQLFAMDDVDVDACLSDLARLGFIERYTREGSQYIQIVNFTKHQRPHNNESQSVIPSSIEDTTADLSEQGLPLRSEVLRSESPFTDSLNAEGGMRNEEARASAPPVTTEPSAIAFDVAETLVQAPWVNDELLDVAHEVDRLFGKVPDFNPRDGPALAELFATWKGYRKKPPENWSMAWLNWLRKEVTDRREKPNQPVPFNGNRRGTRDPNFDGIEAVYEVMKAREAANG